MVNIYTNGSSGFAAFFPVFMLPANDDVDGDDDDEGVAGSVAAWFVVIRWLHWNICGWILALFSL